LVCQFIIPSTDKASFHLAPWSLPLSFALGTMSPNYDEKGLIADSKHEVLPDMAGRITLPSSMEQQIWCQRYTVIVNILLHNKCELE